MTTRIPRHAHTLDLQVRLTTARPTERKALLDGIVQVVGTLTGRPAPKARSELLDEFERLLAPADPSVVWLTLSVLEAAPSEARRAVYSAEIRGNTDESWQRGLRWLLRNRLLATPEGPR